MADRKLQPIYEALDSASPKLALQLCNKALKKQPDSAIVKSLKALAFIRAGKLEECIALTDEIIATKPVDDTVLNTLSHVLRALERPQDVITLYDDAYKQSPNNEELGCQAFIAMAKIGSWRHAQQTALRLHRTFPGTGVELRYLFWGISCMLMQARAPDTPRKMKPTLLGLALRMIDGLPKPGAAASPDKVWLHMSVLIDLGKLELEDGAEGPEQGRNRFNKALELVVNSKQLVGSSLVCEELRKEAMMLAERFVEERDICKSRLEANDRNYTQFTTLIDTTVAIIKKQKAGETPIPAPAAEGENEPAPELGADELYAETRDIFTNISEKEGADERAAPLALIELEMRRRKEGLEIASVESDTLYTLLCKYLSKIGDKACCYNDLADAIASLPEDGPELAKWIEHLTERSQDLKTIEGLRRVVNVSKILRTCKPSVEKISPEDELAAAHKYLKAYLEAAPLCESYPPTEQQPRDDLAVLAASALVSAYAGSGKSSYLTQAVAILEYALSKSPFNHHFRILLIRIYRLIGAPTLAHDHYKGLRVKQMQADSLSHLVLARASTFCLAGDSELVNECIESSQIYTSNVQETPEMVARAFVHEKYSQAGQVPNFVEFEERLECSLQRDLTKMEHTRMRLGFEAQAAESLVLELQDLQLTIVRAHHDNRDTGVIPNYQPRGQSMEQQTSMGPSPGLSWLNVFLQIYIRALEDSLGPSHFTGREYQFDDESQLTPLEVEFRKFTDNLNEWLVVRDLPKGSSENKEKAEASNGGEDANGNGSSSETAKTAADVPALATAVIDYFEGLYKKFTDISKHESTLPWESLHIAGLAQEALVIFEIQSAQFKVPTTGKAKKDPVAQGIKGIRPRASKALKDLAAAMVAVGEVEGSDAKQNVFLEECKDLRDFTEISETFLKDVAKRTTAARKGVFEGWGKGMQRSLI